MRGFHRLSTVLALALVFMAPGVSRAEYFLFDGIHALEFTDFGGDLQASASGSGVAQVNGSSGGSHIQTLELSRPFATLPGVVPITDPIVTAGGLVEIRLDGLRFAAEAHGGAFAPIAGAAQNTALQLTKNTMPVVGAVRYCLFYLGCNSGSLTQTLSETSNGVLVGTGVGGMITLGGSAAVRFSMVGAPWTLKTVSFSNRTINGGITVRTARGFLHGPASLTSSTVGTSGVVQLVTVTQTTSIGASLGLHAPDKTGRITRLTLHLTPEPGLMLLLGAGAAGMGLLGRARIR